nr:unnamed protein product [Digitaria exilis]
MRMTRSAAAPAAAKTISTIVGAPRCTEAGGELPLSREEPLDECSGGGWVLAGENGAPWDLAAGGGDEKESLVLDGAGEDAAFGGDGGDEESADGGGAVEGEGLWLFGGDETAGVLVEEELDDMTRHETINLHKLSRVETQQRMCSPAASAPHLPPPRRP